MVVGHNLSKSLYCRYHLELLLHRYGNIIEMDEHCLQLKINENNTRKDVSMINQSLEIFEELLTGDGFFNRTNFGIECSATNTILART